MKKRSSETSASTTTTTPDVLVAKRKTPARKKVATKASTAVAALAMNSEMTVVSSVQIPVSPLTTTVDLATTIFKPLRIVIKQGGLTGNMICQQIHLPLARRVALAFPQIFGGKSVGANPSECFEVQSFDPTTGTLNVSLKEGTFMMNLDSFGEPTTLMDKMRKIVPDVPQIVLHDSWRRRMYPGYY